MFFQLKINCIKVFLISIPISSKDLRLIPERWSLIKFEILSYDQRFCFLSPRKYLRYKALVFFRSVPLCTRIF